MYLISNNGERNLFHCKRIGFKRIFARLKYFGFYPWFFKSRFLAKKKKKKIDWLRPTRFIIVCFFFHLRSFFLYFFYLFISSSCNIFFVAFFFAVTTSSKYTRRSILQITGWKNAIQPQRPLKKYVGYSKLLCGESSLVFCLIGQMK